MSSLSDKKIVGALIALSIAQVIGWGTISPPAIIGRQIAADLHMKLPAVFAGTSTFYVAMGLCAPWLAKPCVQFGARRVMVAGTAVAAPGFVLLSIAQGPMFYCSAWVILGMAGSAALSTASYIALHEIAGQYAKRAIGALMLVNGLSSSVFWPITSLITEAAGWRSASSTWRSCFWSWRHCTHSVYPAGTLSQTCRRSKAPHHLPVRSRKGAHST
ncbi:MFS transporter [Bradyrhizobium zhanjiangense]|uniref:MFS transporter n=1 Tax=Bradyrhizobium zhanjiangense TaxID=1325107 RepID=UPI00267F2A16